MQLKVLLIQLNCVVMSAVLQINLRSVFKQLYTTIVLL